MMARGSSPRPLTYGEFWSLYLRAHSRPGTRACHYVGLSIGLALGLVAFLTLDWGFLVSAFVIGYAFAWIGHLTIEHNRPATFGHPLWSFFSDFRMLGLWATGHLGPHLARAGVGRKTF